MALSVPCRENQPINTVILDIGRCILQESIGIELTICWLSMGRSLSIPGRNKPHCEHIEAMTGVRILNP